MQCKIDLINFQLTCKNLSYVFQYPSLHLIQNRFMSQWTFSAEPHWPEFVEVKGGFLPPSIAHVIIHHPLLELYSRSSTCFNGIHHGAINFNGEQILRKWPAALDSKLPSLYVPVSPPQDEERGVMFTPDQWTSRARSLDKLTPPFNTSLTPKNHQRKLSIAIYSLQSPQGILFERVSFCLGLFSWFSSKGRPQWCTFSDQSVQ